MVSSLLTEKHQGNSRGVCQLIKAELESVLSILSICSGIETIKLNLFASPGKLYFFIFVFAALGLPPHLNFDSAYKLENKYNLNTKASN